MGQIQPNYIHDWEGIKQRILDEPSILLSKTKNDGVFLLLTPQQRLVLSENLNPEFSEYRRIDKQIPVRDWERLIKRLEKNELSKNPLPIGAIKKSFFNEVGLTHYENQVLHNISAWVKTISMESAAEQQPAKQPPKKVKASVKERVISLLKKEVDGLRPCQITQKVGPQKGDHYNQSYVSVQLKFLVQDEILIRNYNEDSGVVKYQLSPNFPPSYFRLRGKTWVEEVDRKIISILMSWGYLVRGVEYHTLHSKLRKKWGRLQIERRLSILEEEGILRTKNKRFYLK